MIPLLGFDIIPLLITGLGNLGGWLFVAALLRQLGLGQDFRGYLRPCRQDRKVGLRLGLLLWRIGLGRRRRFGVASNWDVL